MAKKNKNDNTNSLFELDGNGEFIDYINIGKGEKNVSSDRPELDRNQRREFTGSNEPNL